MRIPRLPRVSTRRALQASLAAGAALALLLWWLLPGGGPSYPTDPVSFSTGTSRGVYQKYGEMLQEDPAKDLPGIEVRLTRSQGSVDNIERLISGRADFAIAAADAVADAVAHDRSTGRDRLRACARLYDDYMQLVVPADSPVDSARDLVGKRVGIGQEGSGVNLITRRLLEAADLDVKEDLTARQVGIDEAPGLLREGKLDAFFWSGGLPTAAVRDLAKVFDIKLVQLGDLVKPLHEMGEEMGYYRQAIMPADAYDDVHGGAVATIAVANMLITTDRADPGLVERITRTVIDSRDHIGHVVHAAQLVDLRTAIYTDPLELHEGAQRYYRSSKP